MVAFKFSQRSLDNLKGVHPSLVACVNKALGYGVMDFAVTSGLRTLEQQKVLYAQGRTEPGPIVTWTMESKHLPQSDGWGHAVDLDPWPIDYHNMDGYRELADLMRNAAKKLNINIVHGIDWNKPDAPHHQIMI